MRPFRSHRLAASVASVAVLTTGCTGYTLPAAAGEAVTVSDAVHYDNLTPPAAGVPPGIDPTPVWRVDFAGEPKSVGDGFVGLVDTTQTTGNVVIQVINEDGSTRFGVAVPPICSSFVVVQDGTRRLLVTMSTTLTATTPDRPAAKFFATARDLTSGVVAWGPVAVSGAWRGPGLVYGNRPTSQVGADIQDYPASVIRASDGATVLTGDAGLRLPYEHAGLAVLDRPGAGVSVVETETGRQRWDTIGWNPGGAAVPARATGKPSFVAAAGDVVVLSWPTAAGPATVGYDLRTGNTLAEPGAAPVTTAVADARTGAVVLASAPGTGVLTIIDSTSVTARTLPAPPLADAVPDALSGGVLYLRAQHSTTALNLTDGSVVSGGWQPPAATSSTGLTLLAPSAVARYWDAYRPAR